MVRSSFPTTWKVAIEIKRKGKHQDKYHNNSKERRQKMPLYQEFKLKNR